MKKFKLVKQEREETSQDEEGHSNQVVTKVRKNLFSFFMLNKHLLSLISIYY
jgi:hypothetical protein